MADDSSPASSPHDGLYLALISIHGLIRGDNLELGRDADTGGQIKYVLELARALGEQPGIGRVDLLTRRVVDPHVSDDYGAVEELLDGKVRIVRLDAGPAGYIRKEELWDHLDSFADNALAHFRHIERWPDVVHSHYADAGYVGLRIANLLGVPLVHTGHSLGRVKRRRLLASGASREELEQRYNMSRRIEAEEDTLANASLVIASTSNEVEEQYALYNYYRPAAMAVIPPGTDLARFTPPRGDEREQPIAAEMARFLREPDKPMILALSRPDERKNIGSLVKAYGESGTLQAKANLVIVAGNRDDIHDMDAGAQQVMTDLLRLIDAYDLYGKVAYPKHHSADEVPVIYRLAAVSGGVFVNPALTEPFGLTLIEAAACALPIVATEDGGPQDIVGNCRNGILIDPLDTDAMGEALIKVLDDPEQRASYVENGLAGVHEHYSWDAHAKSYFENLTPLLSEAHEPPSPPMARSPLLYHDRAVFTDLDQNLLGDPESLEVFIRFIRQNRKCASFGIATGRRLDSALQVMKRYKIPQPDVLITSVGTEIHYAPDLTVDTAWTEHIDHLWNRSAVRRLLEELPGIKLQPKEFQSRFKISYYIDPEKAPSHDEINAMLRSQDLTVNTILSFGQFLDVIPVRASKGFALRYFADQWGVPLEHILVAGGSGADEDMMRGNTLAVVVANRHHEELSRLAEAERIYFTEKPYAAGILEAIDHYDFYGECRIPQTP
jgi:sucrose-phosphate synthase